MGFTHLEIVVPNSRTEQKVCRVWYKLKDLDVHTHGIKLDHFCALALSLFFVWFSVSLHPALCVIHGLLPCPSPPAASPPTSDEY